MDDTIAKLLHADYSTPQSLHTLERPDAAAAGGDTELTTIKALHNNYRAFTRNLKIAAPKELDSAADTASIIKEVYAYNYQATLPPPEDDYAKLKSAYLQLLKSYNVLNEQLLTTTDSNYKLVIVLASQNKQREDSFPRNIEGIRLLLRSNERNLMAIVEAVINSTTLSKDQKTELLFEVKSSIKPEEDDEIIRAALAQNRITKAEAEAAEAAEAAAKTQQAQEQEESQAQQAQEQEEAQTQQAKAQAQAQAQAQANAIAAQAQAQAQANAIAAQAQEAARAAQAKAAKLHEEALIAAEKAQQDEQRAARVRLQGLGLKRLATDAAPAAAAAAEAAAKAQEEAVAAAAKAKEATESAAQLWVHSPAANNSNL